jgi:hypothetical protein
VTRRPTLPAPPRTPTHETGTADVPPRAMVARGPGTPVETRGAPGRLAKGAERLLGAATGRETAFPLLLPMAPQLLPSGRTGLRFFVPVKTVSEANAHEHWRRRQQRAKGQRLAAKLQAMTAERQLELRGVPKPRLVVRLTRVGARRLDSDNLHGSMKHVRDGIADWLGIDDGRDDLVTWEYPPQQTGKPVGVWVEVEAVGDGQ